MVLKKVKTSDLKDLDTCQRIRETAMNLFALKGFTGVSIREIARIASVNVGAVNYYFQSKEKLRDEIMEEVMKEFRENFSKISGANSTAEFALKFYDLLKADQALTLNRFKLVLDSDIKVKTDPFPVGYEEFSVYFAKELNPEVPEAERLWFLNVLLSYTVHSVVMSSTRVGQVSLEKYFQGGDFIPKSIEKLVTAIIRDLNARYPKGS